MVNCHKMLGMSDPKVTGSFFLPYIPRRSRRFQLQRFLPPTLSRFKCKGELTFILNEQNFRS